MGRAAQVTTVACWLRVAAGAMLVGLAAASAAGQGGAKGASAVEAQMASLRGDLAALRAVRDRLLEQVRQRGAGPAVVVELRFAGLISYPGAHGSLGGDDLVATLRRSGGRWLPGLGSTPQWHAGPHFLDASALTFDGARLAGKLRGLLAFGRGKYNCHCRRVDVELDVDATVAGGKISGTYTTAGAEPIPEMPWLDFTSDGVAFRSEGGPVPPRRGALSGTVRQATFQPTAAAEPRFELGGGYEGMVHKRACWQEQQACRLYREVHACALALACGMAVEHAFALSPDYRPARAAFQAPDERGGKRPKADEPPKLIDMVDSEELGLAPVARAKAPAAAGASGRARELLAAALRPLCEHVAAMRRLAEGWQPGDAGAAEPAAAGAADPAFGPFYGEEDLPRAAPAGGAKPGAAPGVNLLPADAGAPGRQEWRLVGGWVFLGPFPAELRFRSVADLPEVVPAWEAPVAVDARFRGGKNYSVPDTVAPADCELSAGQSRTGLGHTRPPSVVEWDTGLTPRRVDLPRSSFYATAELVAPQDVELWFGLTVNDGGALWVNDHLAWASRPDKDPACDEVTGVFRCRLARGVNRLMLRLDNHTGDTYFSLRVCTRGQAAPAGEAQRRREILAKAYAAMPQPTAGVVGWRGDWTGRYPGSDPPVAWDIEKKINVLWRRPMDYCHATPVIVGDRLFTSVEPHTLVCVNKLDGAVLWRRDCDVFEFKSKQLQAEAKAAREASEKARAELAALGGTKDARLAALRARGMDANQAADRYQELSRQTGRYHNVMRNAGILGPAWGTWTGQTISTPVSDGRHVWVKYNTGVLACFDVEGNRKWMVPHGGTTGTSSHVPSPVLAAGRLIVMLPAGGFGRVHDYKRVTSVLVGYDAASGKEVWTAPTAAGTSGEVTGTPLAMRLTNGDETMDVVVSANGTVVRAEDGKVLRMYLGSREEYGSPISNGAGRVFISGAAHKACYELLMQDRDHVGVRTVWQRWHPGVGYDSGNYALLYGPLLYSFGWRLDVQDAASGAIRSMRHDLLWIRPGRCYPPMALAGGRLYVADYGQFFAQPKWKNHGSGMSVLEPGADGLLLARNRIELLTGGPAFDGRRIYIRSQDSLMCLGHTGRAGEVYEAETVANELLDQLYPDKPAAGATETPKIIRRGDERTGVGAIRAGPLWAKTLPDDWFFLGPVAPGEAGALRDALRSSDLTGADGNSTVGYGMAVAGRRHALQFLSRHDKRHWMKGDGLDVPAVNGGKDGGVSFFLTAVRNDFPRTMRVEMRGRGLRAWLGGLELRHNQLVAMAEGAMPMVMEVAVDKAGEDFPPALVCFWPSRGAEADAERWLAELARRREYLQAAARLSPASAAGRRAAAALALPGSGSPAAAP